MGRANGKSCIVTGAGAGIGRAIAETFAREGAHVFVADIASDAATRVADRLTREGHAAVAVQHDAGDETSWRMLIERVLRETGHLDILINNAASGFAAFIDETSSADWQAIEHATGRGVFVGTKLAIETMSAGGAIINVASVAAAGSISAAVYGAAKAAVIAFTKAAAIHCARQGKRIRVNAVAPGLVNTEGLKGAIQKMTAGRGFLRPLIAWQMRKAVPLGLIGEPADIAFAVLYLASDAARYVTGQTLIVDGGMTAPGVG